jgi:hypothetical protein
MATADIQSYRCDDMLAKVNRASMRGHSQNGPKRSWIPGGSRPTGSSIRSRSAGAGRLPSVGAATFPASSGTCSCSSPGWARNGARPQAPG